MFLGNRLKTMVTRKVYGGKYVFFREAVSLEGAVTHKMRQKTAPSAEDEAVRRLIRIRLKKRLYEILTEALTDLERECFLRRYIYEQSYRQIQDGLKLKSTKAVDNAIARVKQKLMKHPVMVELWENIAG